jgi:hypothetical protein
MKNLRFIFITFSFLFVLSLCSAQSIRTEKSSDNKPGNLLLGWSKTDLSPDVAVLLKGQFPARVSEGILDPITATALAIESATGSSSGKVILISCDLISIDDANESGAGSNLLDLVRSKLIKSLPEINPNNVILNATHTHTAPYISNETGSKNFYGVELDALSPAACMKYVSERLEKVAIQAWKNRKPGGIS